MGIKNDVFGLEQIYRLQIEGNWSVKNDVWVAPSPFISPSPNTGYFAGGGSPSSSSIIDRIDYDNDTATASPKGPLTVAKGGMGGTGNSTFGYYGGSYPATSRVERVEYTNDTVTASIKGSLTAVRAYSAAKVMLILVTLLVIFLQNQQ